MIPGWLASVRRVGSFAEGGKQGRRKTKLLFRTERTMFCHRHAKAHVQCRIFSGIFIPQGGMILCHNMSCSHTQLPAHQRGEGLSEGLEMMAPESFLINIPLLFTL